MFGICCIFGVGGVLGVGVFLTLPEVILKHHGRILNKTSIYSDQPGLMLTFEGL